MTKNSELRSEPSEANFLSHFVLSLSWLWVGAPLVWGVFSTFQKALSLFQ
jgi:hypothetical protein